MNEGKIQVPKPKHLIGDSVMFNNPNGYLGTMGKVTGARFFDEVWHYSVISEDARKADSELFEVIETELIAVR